MAAQMVGAFGMGGSLISLEASRGPGDIVSKVLSDETSRRAVEGLLEAARTATSDVLKANLHVVEALRGALLERDELIGDEIITVIEGAGNAPGAQDAGNAQGDQDTGEPRAVEGSASPAVEDAPSDVIDVRPNAARLQR